MNTFDELVAKAKEEGRRFYFARLGIYNQPQNEYQKYIIKYLKCMTNQIVTEDIERYKKDLIHTLEVYHKDFSRCKKIDFSFYQSNSNRLVPEFSLATGGVWTISYTLYPVRF
ncbi:MAG: hypothetical protein M9898_02090 [Chitinophagaceae bacterium]|nr:hypothetical protein [Chitinophagaceae bacterium]